jgi:hypothetical protein
VLAQPNRTSTFVADVDREILKSLAPEQLDALAQRAWRRRAQAASELEATRMAGDAAEADDEERDAAAAGRENGRERRGRREGQERKGKDAKGEGVDLRLVVPGPLEPARHAIEQVLERLTKRFDLLSTASRANGGTELLYRVRCRKRLPAERLAREVRAEAAAFLSEATVR